MSYCRDITDSSLISLSKCAKLNTFESRGCPLITSLGIAAIAVGCKQLSKLDIKKCHNIDNTAMLPLAHFSQNLRQVLPFLCNLFHFSPLIRARTLAHIQNYDSLFLFQIILSYSSVTDVGLLSLANISCLQNLTVLHLKGLTRSGLVAALLACRGLTKVKLHVAFKSLLPQALFEHLEARGCVFEWRDKEFQVCSAFLITQLNNVET